IALFEFNAIGDVAAANALVVVVDRHAKDPLGIILPNDIIVQLIHDFTRRRQALEINLAVLVLVAGILLKENPLAQFNTVVADEDPIGSCNQAFNFVMAAPAKRTALIVRCKCHLMIAPA